MKARRDRLGINSAELAERAGISASYVSLIEKGAKVPDEEVAASLARALDDDEALYRGWSRASRLGLEKLQLLSRLEAIAQTPAYVSLVESGQPLPKRDPEAPRLRQRDDAVTLRSRLKEVASRLSSRPLSNSPQKVPAATAVTHSRLADQVSQARAHYQRAREAQRKGNWALYGEEIERLGEILEQMSRGLGK
jgi:transcriptional regulator with XRE-family HTH domain